MLILGEKYRFTKSELNKLEKKFQNIDFTIYKDKDVDSVTKDIESFLRKDRFSVIVINTKAKVDDKIVKYLTNLKYDNRFKYIDRKSTRLNSSHIPLSRMPSSA